MREEFDRAVDKSISRNKQLTDWRKILFAIINEFDGMPDGYVITIQGDQSATSEPRFVNQMRLTLGQLRGMK